MVEDFSHEDEVVHQGEAVASEPSEPKKPGRKALLLVTALALLGGEKVFAEPSKEPDLDAVVLQQPDVASALKKKETAFQAVKDAESDVIQAGKAIARTQSELDSARARFKKKRTPTFRDEVEQARLELQKARTRKEQALRLLGVAGEALVKAEQEYAAVLELKRAEEVLKRAQQKARALNIADETASQTRTALAVPGETTIAALPLEPRRKNISVAYSAGPTFSLSSSGDNAVESPGVIVQADLEGVSKPSRLISAELEYSPIGSRVSTRNPRFIARDPDKKLDGSIVTLRTLGMKDFSILDGDAFDASLRVGGGFGAALIYTEGGTDVGVARKPDKEGRREFANVPSQAGVFPVSCFRAGVVVETRDGITGAIEGTVTLGAYPIQINTGDPDRYDSLFYDASVGATVGYEFH